LTEAPGLASGLRKRCPSCGSIARKYAVSTDGELKPVGILRARGFAKSPSKWFKEVIKGADWSTRLKRWVQQVRIIDRRRDRYTEKVIDPETGEVMRDIEEPLSKHTQRGSARNT